MTDRDTTQPWHDHQFIRIHKDGKTLPVCYRSSKDRIVYVALPGRRVFELHQFFFWTSDNGWKVDLPLKLHTDIA